MIFADFAKFLDDIENTSSRNEMTENLAEFMKELEGEEIKQIMYLMGGRLVPKYVDLEFNISDKLVVRALAELESREEGGEEELVKELTKKLREVGDVGLLAEDILTTVGTGRDQCPHISEVYVLLETIANFSGTGSQEQKIQGMKELFLMLDPISARYVARIIIGKLRLGLSDKTILDALSWAKVGDKSLRKDIERAFGAKADIGEMADLVLGTGDSELVDLLAQIKMEAGFPVAAKLVEREKTAEGVFKRLGACILQPKLDGMRAQIHKKSNGDVQVYSRGMENLTAMFPDLVESVKKLDVDSIIIDSEAIGYDYIDDVFVSFQQTMSRPRKGGERPDDLPSIKAMSFDLLYLNGEDVSQWPLEDRLAKLKEIVDANQDDAIDLLESPLLKEEGQVEEYFQDAVSRGLEGVIAKKLGTPYDPGTRNYDWIKLKANTQSHLVDTVDAVVIGYYGGKGVRAKFGIGTLLVALYNPKNETYDSVAKVGSGVKDDQWEQIKKDLSELEIESQPENVIVEKILHPDVWVRPEIVIEVLADEITRSPSHSAGKDIKASFETDHKGRGLSLRFPRLQVWNRDKGPEQATTDVELVKMFELRKGDSS